MEEEEEREEENKARQERMSNAGVVGVGWGRGEEER